MRKSTRARLIAFATAMVLATGFISTPAVSGTFDDIKAKGTVVVATEAAYPPFEFVQDGEIVGFDKDLLDLVVAGWGVKLEQLDVPFAGILAGLLEKKYDFVCTGLIMNPERTSKYAFTLPVAVSPIMIIKRTGDTNVSTLKDLSGLKIGGPVPPSGPMKVLQDYSDGLGSKGADIVAFQSAPDAFLALANGQIDAAVESQLVLDELMKKQPDTFEIVGEIGAPIYYGWATRPEDTDLRDAINVELEKAKNSGKLAELQMKWFGRVMETPTSGYLPPGSK